LQLREALDPIVGDIGDMTFRSQTPAERFGRLCVVLYH
jgi:hypothetical protein